MKNTNIENLKCEELCSEELIKTVGGGWLKNIFYKIGFAIAEYDNRYELDLSALAGGNQDSGR